MGRSIRQIQQELEAIEEKVIEFGQELQTLYEKYIACLSNSAQKQLILAGYQLCTRIYPEAFVAMSLTQRQNLQQSLQKLGKELEPLLAQKPTAEEISQEQVDLNLIAQMLKNLPLSTSRNTDPEAEEAIHEVELSTDEDDLESDTTIAIEEDEELVRGAIQEIDLEKLQNLAERELKVTQISEIDLSNPEHLLLWQKRVEKKIRTTLNDTSRQANEYLKQFDIIPRHLPSKVIDVALKSQKSNSGGKLRSIPNILNLVVETDKGEKNQKSQTNATQISLLRLHLSEIEFTDATLSSKRNEIRMVVRKIQKLESLYQKKKHEYTQAEADAAWRSSWYED